jgi:hypothetical protein
MVPFVKRNEYGARFSNNEEKDTGSIMELLQMTATPEEVKNTNLGSGLENQLSCSALAKALPAVL